MQLKCDFNLQNTQLGQFVEGPIDQAAEFVGAKYPEKCIPKGRQQIEKDKKR